jgi:hypothetical protein
MSRVLHRVYAHQIEGKVTELLKKEVDIVLTNNSVLHGIIFSVSGTKLVLKNIVRNKTKIEFEDIKEIMFV